MHLISQRIYLWTEQLHRRLHQRLVNKTMHWNMSRFQHFELVIIFMLISVPDDLCLCKTRLENLYPIVATARMHYFSVANQFHANRFSWERQVLILIICCYTRVNIKNAYETTGPRRTNGYARAMCNERFITTRSTHAWLMVFYNSRRIAIRHLVLFRHADDIWA